MKTTHTYALEEDNHDLISYISDEFDGKRIILQAVKTSIDGDERWRVEGLIEQDSLNGEIIDDSLRPAPQTLYRTREKAEKALERAVATKEPVNILLGKYN